MAPSVRPDQIEPHLAAQGLPPLVVLVGDEPLQAQEAGDAVRAAARAAGIVDRLVFTLGGAHPDWGAVIGATQSRSLFAERQLVELRLPGGKPGKDGAEIVERLANDVVAQGDDGNVLLVTLPRLDRQQQQSAWFGALSAHGLLVRCDPLERRLLPAWLARRLARQGQRVADGDDGARTLAFIADRVEGNLLAAHQELQKLALLQPHGVLDPDAVRRAVLDVARYDVFKLGEAVLAGDARRALRMLAGLRAEGEAPTLVLWTLAEELRTLARVRAALDAGRPLAAALREQRVWGPREAMVERAVVQLDASRLARLLETAAWVDGRVKGLAPPGSVGDAWTALRQLAWQCARAVAPPPRRTAARG